MSISIFLSPVYSRPFAATAAVTPRAVAPAPRSPSWEALAQEQRWKESLVAYLQLNWQRGRLLWSVVNAIAAEALPADRRETREFTRQVLEALMELVREKQILRYKKKWIAALELPHIVAPLEQPPSDRSGRSFACVTT